MVEVSVLFLVVNGPINDIEFVNSASFYLIKEDKRYTMLTERVLKCHNFKIKIDQMIASTPFNVKRILYTFGFSAIAIVDNNKSFNWLSTSIINKKWAIFNLNESYKYVNGDDYRIIKNFLNIIKYGKFFE